jgi:hypothetical protein
MRPDNKQSVSQKLRSILAKSPAEFANASDIVPKSDYRFNEEFVMTNKGLRIQAGLANGPPGDYISSLNCSRKR